MANTSPALRCYRDSRAIHLASIKRWRADLASTAGNPRVLILANHPPFEVRRDAVEAGIAAARQALANARARLNRSAAA